MNGESVMEVAASPDTEIEDGLPYTHDGVNFDEIFLFLLVGVWYFTWRIYTFAPDAPIFFWTVYLAEIYGFISAALHIFVTWRMTIRVPIPPVAGLKVDVFIPTYNEPVDLVRKTILAATHMDYPHETWVLDDGRRPEMAELAKRLEVNYIARDDNRHAKAGNLNNALRQTTGAFIAIFDADHAPQKNFLTSTLGYFSDTKVAFVQTPQDFFNLDSFQHRVNGKKKEMWTEQSLFFKVIQRGKDYWNAAFFCGSCAVVRRSALDLVGGFATATVTEDLHTSIKLHKAGFRSVYHPESVAFGIAPSTVAPFLQQRVRWGQGAMQVLKKENIFFTRELTIIQRLNYAASMMTYFDGWQKGIFYIAPVIVLTMGIMPIKADGVDFLLHFLPYYLLSLWVFKEAGRGYGGILYMEQYNFARFAAFIWATCGLFAGKLQFKVTNKAQGGSASSFIIFLPQWTIFFLNVVAIPVGLFLAYGGSLRLDALTFNLVWACINVAMALTMFTFTRKTESFLRAEYRFPIPMPMQLQDGTHLSVATIDNINSTGCRIYGRLPVFAKKGGSIRGILHLPSGPLVFSANVMSEISSQAGGEKYISAVGCNFIWDDQRNRDALELFLYGTDFQRRLSGIHEESRTPMQWLLGRFSGVSELGVDRNTRWASCALKQLGKQNLPLVWGLVRLPSDGGLPPEIVTFASLEPGSRVVVIVYTRSKQLVILATISNKVKLENSAGEAYICSVDNCVIPKDGEAA